MVTSNQLCDRLRQHAALHHDLAKHSDEQAQWGKDLEAAADEIELLQSALKRAVKQCGHEYNCSAARGSEQDCTCGWTAAKELARNL